MSHLVHRKRRLEPESVADLLLRAFFGSLGILALTALLGALVESIPGIDFVVPWYLLVAPALAFWIHAIWRTPLSRRERLLLSCFSCAILVALWLIVTIAEG